MWELGWKPEQHVEVDVVTRREGMGAATKQSGRSGENGQILSLF